jgi:pimeloyl-ACP methyl ester carboxylesterase
MNPTGMNSPKWLDRILYPFAHHTMDLPAGRMHYVDEGQGETIVFVHGTPTWSFVWRQQIKALSRTHRCIAPDHLGFGLSDKPTDFAYTPAAQADNLEQLIIKLQLKNITLVVHDFGGPIGLNYAIRHPENVKRLVILNTWMWSLADEKQMMRISEFLKGGIGSFLYLNLGFSARVLLPRGYLDKRHISKHVQQHYTKPLGDSQSRQGTWLFAKALKESGDWFAQLWQQRERLSGIPKLILWGEKDALLPLHFLDTWKNTFPDAQVKQFKAGHFVQEEKGGEVADAIKQFI